MVRIVSVIIFGAVFFLNTQQASAQVTITNKSTQLHFTSGTVYLTGSYENKPGPSSFPSQFFSFGVVRLTGDITNDAPVDMLDAASETRFVLTGPGNQTISGSSPITFYDLELSKSGSMILARNINVENSLTLTSGSIDLTNFRIDLIDMGELLNETGTNRVSTTGTGTINFTIPANPNISNVLGGLGLRLQGNIFNGATIARGHLQQNNAGDGSIFRYFDVNLNTGCIPKCRISKQPEV